MKDVYVAQLEAEQAVTSFFLVCAKEIRTSRNTGKPYLDLDLGDRTGVILGRLFESAEARAAEIKVDQVVKVKGRVDLYNGRKQIVIDKVRPAEDGEYELADFLPHTRHDVEELWNRLLGFVAEVQNPWLRRLLDDVLSDAEVASRFRRAPAGKAMHHAYIGGLLEHVVSLLTLCRAVAPLYPEIDADLLITGAVLHDLGKVEELHYERGFGYTDEGLLLGHIVIELEMLGRKMDAIEGFPSTLRTLVRHLCASHHGQHEFGSPVLPRFPEAVMLHYLDDLDSKLGAMRATLENTSGDANWTERNPALGRALLRLDRFRKDEPAEMPPPGEDAGS